MRREPVVSRVDFGSWPVGKVMSPGPRRLSTARVVCCRFAVGLVAAERLEVVALPVRDETIREHVPPEHVPGIAVAPTIPAGGSRLPCCGVTEVERAVLAP